MERSKNIVNPVAPEGVKVNKIRLEVKKRVAEIENPFNSKRSSTIDSVYDNIYNFERGKIYGIVCEPGEGGAAVSCLMSNQIPWEDEKIYFDGIEVKATDIGEISWYVGKPVYSRGLIKKEISVREALEYAVSQYHRYENLGDIVSEFGLETSRWNQKLTIYSYERWRASLAIGYASNRIVYCFPWLDTCCFYNWIINSSVFRFFKKLRDEGNILILPTIRRANVEGFVDEVIEINNPGTDRVVADNQCFKDAFWKSV